MLPLPPCSVEHLFVIVKINFVYYILVNAYFPPRSTITLNNKHFDIINDLLISYPYVKNIILVGNYNTPNLKWQFTSPSCSPTYLNLNQLSVDFLSKISFLNLSQFNTALNKNNTILNLVLSNIDNITVSKFTTPLVPCDVHHPSLLIIIPLNTYKPIDYNLFTYNFYSCNYSDIIKCSCSINWVEIFSNLNVNEVTN
jgi:hypothetical protein